MLPGALAMYSAGNDNYDLVRMLLDMTPRNEDLGPNALSVSHDSKRLAFIGPSEYTICVVDARSLDEVNNGVYILFLFLFYSHFFLEEAHA